MKHNITPPTRTDRAILFLRIFIAAVMLLHIIGKMQNYDNVVLTFPSLLDFNRPTSLALSIIFEAAMAAMIAIGIGTRLSALLMFITSLVTLFDIALQAEGAISTDAAKLQFIYAGIFLTLMISGGGRYSISIGQNVPKS
ncbi:MAG: DoxX family protein [Alistipes sp.]|jgi:putative oxidoreductase|nr:DoxX family protein [Alistipes sp.]